MAWALDSERPIYTQILERIQIDIISGTYKPGEKLPSVRDLAAEAAVNPNTMQKALSELERTGLVYAQRTSGRYITEDVDLIQDMKKEIAESQIRDFLEKMSRLGLNKEDTLKLMEILAKEEDT
ncbi:GntR family transcriptional regulator [Murimonas intestini]|uniref:DNA-binding transcriptional regulator YhcF (GntR family) n=1 Tax=Murimonas intestini TaxID=1337051 RepID=A0AB73T6W2_9FIRM|nr:GntR family transcriptional regulator [Murimonas intestini]MCR1839540.1 GntR family transcriptional regulator [Murimonas intestini]MCR1866383.1 GntR family transcriptional regulator [Murimonas intestini]MCR1882499.1 GntR family transcriptional regulator [Murimonas intestini]